MIPYIQARRLIPACAGKTLAAEFGTLLLPAHPRVCGENAVAAGAAASAAGSSPRVRGKRSRRNPRRYRSRLIPACAGKTKMTPMPTRSRWAHPRVCGENLAASKSAWAWMGSSPRVRGKRLLPSHSRNRGGLIPACAGKTDARGTQDKPSEAHPRVCGENCCCFLEEGCCGGSSPRVRGKRTTSAQPTEALGLIPACAGKTRGFVRECR